MIDLLLIGFVVGFFGGVLCTLAIYQHRKKQDKIRGNLW